MSNKSKNKKQMYIKNQIAKYFTKLFLHTINKSKKNMIFLLLDIKFSHLLHLHRRPSFRNSMILLVARYMFLHKLNNFQAKKHIVVGLITYILEATRNRSMNAILIAATPMLTPKIFPLVLTTVFLLTNIIKAKIYLMEYIM